MQERANVALEPDTVRARNLDGRRPGWHGVSGMCVDIVANYGANKEGEEHNYRGKHLELGSQPSFCHSPRPSTFVCDGELPRILFYVVGE